MSKNSDVKQNTEIEQLADRCVKCGMCLQSCPTYQKTLHEGESPRGRISLIQGLLSGELKTTSTLLAHLDSCLKCRACEDICPSDVPYGTIIDTIHNHIESSFKRGLFYRIFRKTGLSLVKHAPLLSIFFSTLRFYQQSGLQWLASHSLFAIDSRFAQLNSALPLIPKKPNWQTYYPPLNTHQGDIALFTGCIARTLDVKTLQSSINVMTKLGYGVYVPRNQRCCGALHQHNGAKQQANLLLNYNEQVFGKLKIDAIISVASGCGTVLAEGLTEGLTEGSNGVSAQVIDINTFLSTIKWPENINLKPLNKTIVIHDPCSLRRVWRQHDKPYQLLKKIPQIKIESLPHNDQCCGAAGSYMLTHPQMANSLRDDKLNSIQAQPFDFLATSNIGCALHFAAGLKADLKKRQTEIDIIHPVVLIDQQIEHS